MTAAVTVLGAGLLARAGVWRDAGLSHVGKVRSRNEDALVQRPGDGLWAVADGMGGLERGDWAAELVAGALRHAVLHGRLEPDAEALAAAIQSANDAICRQSQAQGAAIGSTVVGLLMHEARFAVLWAGDSRAYRLRGGVLVQLTRDHTQVQDRVDRGYMTPEEARTHPMAHVLTRAVGVTPTLELDALYGDVEAGDLFLLCSDGLHGVASDAEIADGLASGSPEESCARLLTLCLERGAPDNVTLAAVAA